MYSCTRLNALDKYHHQKGMKTWKRNDSGLYPKTFFCVWLKRNGMYGHYSSIEMWVRVNVDDFIENHFMSPFSNRFRMQSTEAYCTNALAHVCDGQITTYLKLTFWMETKLKHFESRLWPRHLFLSFNFQHILQPSNNIITNASMFWCINDCSGRNFRVFFLFFFLPCGGPD